jgi:uncharacterized protein YwgA
MAYFATAAGLPTGLGFSRGSYGPFSPDLKPMISRLVNQGLLAEEKLGNMIRIQPGPTFKHAVHLVSTEEKDRWRPIVERVADLMLRMRTRDAEVAGSVHFEAEAQRAALARKPSEMEVVRAVLEWKQRRRPPLSEEEVRNAVRRLNVLGWVDLAPSHELDPVDEELAFA